jgi:hypothetical protein
MGQAGKYAGVVSTPMSRGGVSLNPATRSPGADLVLKELFGGQLSDAERESESKTYYNDMMGPEENARILQSKIDQLEKIIEKNKNVLK